MLIFSYQVQYNELDSFFPLVYPVLHKQVQIFGFLNLTKTYLYENLSYHQPKHLSKTWRRPFRNYGVGITLSMMNKNLLYN